MITEIVFAIIQAITEFLPISSSGHLALISNFFSAPNLLFFIFLHIASLIAVLIFLRKELISLVLHPKKNKKLWFYWIIATIPAALFGYLFSNLIEQVFSSVLFLGLSFIFTGVILHLTKYVHRYSSLNLKNSFFIGLAQIFALFPGVSRSGMTISSGLFLGMNREKATRFSFLLFVPLSLGAFILELAKIQDLGVVFNTSWIFSFIICLFFSLVSLNCLSWIIKKEKFWIFSFYCWIIGVICLIISL